MTGLYQNIYPGSTDPDSRIAYLPYTRGEPISNLDGPLLAVNCPIGVVFDRLLGALMRHSPGIARLR